MSSSIPISSPAHGDRLLVNTQTIKLTGCSPRCLPAGALPGSAVPEFLNALSPFSICPGSAVQVFNSEIRMLSMDSRSQCSLWGQKNVHLYWEARGRFLSLLWSKLSFRHLFIDRTAIWYFRIEGFTDHFINYQSPNANFVFKLWKTPSEDIIKVLD